MMTTQAERLAETLRGYGLRQRKTRVGGFTRWADFGVRTLGDGRTGFGNAYASLKSQEAREAVLDHVWDLIADDNTVVLYLAEDGRLRHLAVTTAYNRSKVLQLTHADGTIQWLRRDLSVMQELTAEYQARLRAEYPEED
jgi:hypothetical protein